MTRDLLLLQISFSKHNVHCLIELTGTVKLFRYPFLNVERRLEAIRLNTCKNVKIDSKFVYELTGMFKKLFCLEFFNRNHKWPPFKSVGDKVIRKHYLNNKWLNPQDEKMILLSDWDSFTFDKTFEYDYTIDTTELLKDSALATEYNNWGASYDKCAFNFLYGKPNPKSESYEKRVIVEYLNGNKYAAREKIIECQLGFRSKSAVKAVKD